MASNFISIPKKDYGEIVGKGLGDALSTGLQQLANHKLEKIQRSNQKHQLMNAFKDLPPEVAEFLYDKTPETQLKYLELIGNHRQAEEEKELSGLQQLQQNPQQGPAQQESSTMGQNPTETEPEMIQDAQYAADLERGLQTPHIVEQMSPEEIQDATSQLEQLKQKLSQNPVGQNPFPKEAPVQQAAQPKQAGIPLTALAKPKAIQEAKKEDHAEMIRSHKESQEFDDELRGAVQAKNAITDKLKQYKQILEKGKFSAPGTVATVNAVKAHGWGPDIGPSVLTPDTQKLNKISSSFIKDAIRLGGSKATNFMEQKFLESYPNPAQPKEVQLANIDLVLQEFNGLQERYDALKDIKKSNGGYRPLDVASLIDEKIVEQEASKKKIENEPQPTADIAPQTNQQEASAVEPSSALGDISRTIGGAVARTGEKLAGTPHTLLNLIPHGEEYKKIAAKEGFGDNPLPSEETFRGLTRKLTGESLEPKTPLEEAAQNFGSLVGTLYSPTQVFGGGYKAADAIKMAMGGKIGGLVGGFIGGEPGEILGNILGLYSSAPKLSAEKSKFSKSRAFNKPTEKVEKVMRHQYKKAAEIGKGHKQNAADLDKVAKSLIAESNQGLQTKEKELARKYLDGIRDSINYSTKEIPVDELTTLNRDLNALSRKGGDMKYYADKLKTPVVEGLDSFSKTHKEFGKNWRGAQDKFKGLAAAQKVGNAKATAPGHQATLKSKIAKALFGITAKPGVDIGRELYKSYEFLKNSKTGRKYYIDALKAGAQQNIPLMARELIKLDHEAQKYD